MKLNKRSRIERASTDTLFTSKITSIGIAQKITQVCFLPLSAIAVTQHSSENSGQRVYSSGFTHIGLSFAGGVQLRVE